MDTINKNLSKELDAMLLLTGEKPCLESIWALMDIAWYKTKANPNDKKSMADFYSHPVWTLNGLFTETDEESVKNRRIFSEYITQSKPKRIADYGGGFGSLARRIADLLPEAQIEIIEPYPSTMAKEFASKYPNIHFVEKLTGEYDVITIIDVLEHVEEPLNLTYTLATHISDTGILFFGNCFYPVIKCHLQSTFYLRYSFKFLLSKMGLERINKLLYAEIYKKNDLKKLCHPQNITFYIALSKMFFSFTKIVKPSYDLIKKLNKIKK